MGLPELPVQPALSAFSAIRCCLWTWPLQSIPVPFGVPVVRPSAQHSSLQQNHLGYPDGSAVLTAAGHERRCCLTLSAKVG